MGKALSMDFRGRVVAAVGAGLSRRKAAERFGVSAASAISWVRLSRSTGHVRPKPVGGDQRSARVEACAPVILAVVEARADIALVELRALLAQRGVGVAVSRLYRALLPVAGLALQLLSNDRYTGSFVCVCQP